MQVAADNLELINLQLMREKRVTLGSTTSLCEHPLREFETVHSSH
jgi:predicted HTH domain antitoxin